MPTYEYRCIRCGDFEVDQPITDRPLAACPTCGAAVRKLMPRRLFVSFKGPGFHVNDYPSGNRKRDTTADAPAAGAGAGKPAAGAETAATGRAADGSSAADRS